jgi:5-oxoprolinase (ATP-hydrolysing) subunit A
LLKVAPFGDAAIEIVADDVVHARRIARAVERVAGVIDVVVGWDRVVAHLEDGITPTIDEIEGAIEVLPADDPRNGTLHVVRAIYDGPDLQEVADRAGLSPIEVARRHAAVTYVVEVIGFLPGFAYLGTLDPGIATPRRATPRPRVPPLSVGIADARTAIYPLPSPGGWNLIARAVDPSPFDPTRMPPSRFAVGDRVRFEMVEPPQPGPVSGRAR